MNAAYKRFYVNIQFGVINKMKAEISLKLAEELCNLIWWFASSASRFMMYVRFYIALDGYSILELFRYSIIIEKRLNKGSRLYFAILVFVVKVEINFKFAFLLVHISTPYKCSVDFEKIYWFFSSSGMRVRN